MVSSHEISLQIDEKEKELKEAISAHELIEQQKLRLQRAIIRLQLKKKELEMVLSKSSANRKQIEIELRLLKNRFWAVKNEGR